jgi:hypothetical protein
MRAGQRSVRLVIADGVCPDVAVEAYGGVGVAAGVDGAGQDGLYQPEGGVTEEVIGGEDLHGPGPGGEDVMNEGGGGEYPLPGLVG